MEAILAGLVRVGKVTDYDVTKGQVRVLFPDTGLTSGWLFCIQNSAGISISANQDHAHTATVAKWLPAVNQTVVCLYLPLPNADGFVLGTIEGGTT